MSTVKGFQVGSETLKYDYESLDNYNTPNFSTSSSTTYAVGDYVMYNGKLYKCTTATTGGTWVDDNWTETVLSDDVSDLTRQLSDVEENQIPELNNTMAQLKNSITSHVKSIIKKYTKNNQTYDGTILFQGTYSIMRSSMIRPLKFPFDVSLKPQDGWLRLVMYNDDFTLKSTSSTSTDWSVVPANTLFCFVMEKDSASVDVDIKVSSYNTINCDSLIPKLKINEGFRTESGGTELIQKIVNSSQAGAISGDYLYYIYSTSAKIARTKIYGNPVEISATSINYGHGNAMQLYGNVGYVWGWDDNTIYKIALTDGVPSLTEAITLPTTGYTSGVVDHLNQIAYIFQRDTLPTSYTNYKFIVYDIANSQVKMEKYIERQFLIQQDCDFYNGLIYVLFGTQGTEKGVLVFNTNGDLIREISNFYLGDVEPELITHDANGDMYIGMFNKQIIKIVDE